MIDFIIRQGTCQWYCPNINTNIITNSTKKYYSTGLLSYYFDQESIPTFRAWHLLLTFTCPVGQVLQNFTCPIWNLFVPTNLHNITFGELYEHVVTCLDAMANPQVWPEVNESRWNWDSDTKTKAAKFYLCHLKFICPNKPPQYHRIMIWGKWHVNWNVKKWRINSGFLYASVYLSCQASTWDDLLVLHANPLVLPRLSMLSLL